MRLLRIIPSTQKNKRYTAEFMLDTNKIKKIHFGSPIMENFTIHKDEKRKMNYLKRHQANENWNEPLSPGALSRWILWNKPTLEESILDFIKRFSL